MASMEQALLLPEEWLLLAFAVLPLLSLASHLLLEPLSSNSEQPRTLADIEAFTDADAEEQRAVKEQQDPWDSSQTELVRDFRSFEESEPIQRVKTFKRTKTRNRETQKGPGAFRPIAMKSAHDMVSSSSSIEDQTSRRNSSAPMMTRFFSGSTKKSGFGSIFGGSRSSSPGVS